MSVPKQSLKKNDWYSEIISFLKKSKHNLLKLLKRREYQIILLFVVFLVLYKIGDYIWEYIENHGFFHHTTQILYNFLIEFIAKTSALFYSLFFKSVETSPGGFLIINGRTDIFVGPGCTGLKQTLLILFIIIFYPISYKLKTFLIPLSAVIILTATILHFIMLVPVARSFPDWFRFAHDYLTMTIFYGFFFLTWLFWEKIRETAAERDKLHHNSKKN